MQITDVRRVDFGFFVRPAAETGTGTARVEPCLGYLLRHPDGLLLMDTGMGRHPAVDEHYRPQRRSLDRALDDHGVTTGEITHVVNCHLHFDHCGGNPELSGRPVFAQTVELAAARETADYTLPELIDAPGTVWEAITGEVELLPGVRLLPTPGHTDGHQSLVVRCDDGTVVVAGQSHDTATAFGADALALRVRDSTVPLPPAWLQRLLAMDPARVLLAHDHSVWEP